MIVRRLWPGGSGHATPNTDIDRMRQEMERLLSSLTTRQAADPGAGVFPAVNVSQDGDAYYVRAEVPGVASSALEVTATGTSLTIAGTRETTPPGKEVSYHRREREEGGFRRAISLPGEIDGKQVDARYVNGILTVRLPKAAATKPKQIKVKTN